MNKITKRRILEFICEKNRPEHIKSATMRSWRSRINSEENISAEQIRFIISSFGFSKVQNEVWKLGEKEIEMK